MISPYCLLIFEANNKVPIFESIEWWCWRGDFVSYPFFFQLLINVQVKRCEHAGYEFDSNSTLSNEHFKHRFRRFLNLKSTQCLVFLRNARAMHLLPKCRRLV